MAKSSKSVNRTIPVALISLAATLSLGYRGHVTAARVAFVVYLAAAVAVLVLGLTTGPGPLAPHAARLKARIAARRRASSSPDQGSGEAA